MELTRRIGKLEDQAADSKPVLLWIEPEESAEAAVKRYLLTHPEDAGREVLCLSWMMPGQGTAGRGAGFTAALESNHLTSLEN